VMNQRLLQPIVTAQILILSSARLVGHAETTLRVAAVARNRKFNSLLFVCTELSKHFAVVRKRAHKTHKIE
jgi:hypothetical protein